MPSRGGYYSFDLGDWHLIALNSQLCKGTTWNPVLGQGVQVTRSASISKGCGPGTPMYEWLKRDLVLHPNRQYPCTLAYWHHPLFGTEPHPQGVFLLQLQPIWELLDEHGVDVVLSGHDHNYQRFAPQDAFGRGGSGRDPRSSSWGPGETRTETCRRANRRPNLEAAHDASFGVLRMTLEPGTYDFEFVTAEGERAFSDAGEEVACR